ncbi:hypothetical protein Tco_0466080, partial [Tanacetum coccineum]
LWDNTRRLTSSEINQVAFMVLNEFYRLVVVPLDTTAPQKSFQSLGLVQIQSQRELEGPVQQAISAHLISQNIFCTNKEKETSQGNLNGPVSNAALREYCDKHYIQLLSILAEKIQQEKEHRAEKGPQKRLGSKRIRSVFGGPESRRGRSESPRKKSPEIEMVFKRLERGMFHRFTLNKKWIPASKKHIVEEHPQLGVRTEAMSESEDSA